MAAHKFLKNNAGSLAEESAVVASSGVTDEGKLVALDSTGKLSLTVMPTAIGTETSVIPCTENLAAGDWVNVYPSSGVKCRKADATTSGKEARGFVLSAYTSGDDATVYFTGKANDQLSSLTPGTLYFLSTTPGLGTITAPSATGNIVQELGMANSATEIVFSPTKPITLA